MNATFSILTFFVLAVFWWRLTESHGVGPIGNETLTRRVIKRSNDLESVKRATIQKLDTISAEFRRFQFKISKNQPNVKSTIESSIDASIQTAKENTNRIDHLGNANNFLGGVNALVNNLGNLKSEKPADVALGVVSIVGAFSAFVPPPVGPAISSLLSIVAITLGALQQQPSMADIIKEIIQQALHEQTMKELEAEVEGARDFIVQSQVFMRRYIGRTNTYNSLNLMNSQVKPMEETRLFGKLRKHMQRLSEGTNNVTEAQSAVKLARLYAELSSLRELMVRTHIGIMEKCKECEPFDESLQDVLQNMRETEAASYVFLRKPEVKHMTAAAYYNAEDPANAIIETRMNALEVTAVDPVEAGCYGFKSAANTGREIYYTTPSWGSGQTGSGSGWVKFQDSKGKSSMIQKDGNFWKILGNKMYPWCLTSADSITLGGRCDGDNGMWRIFKLANGQFYIASKSKLGEPIGGDTSVSAGKPAAGKEAKHLFIMEKRTDC